MITKRIVATVASVICAFTCCCTASGYNNEAISVGNGTETLLSAKPNTGQQYNETKTTYSDSSASYEQYAAYYDIWKSYNKLFNSPIKVQTNLYGENGKYIQDLSGLFATQDGRFFEIGEFTLPISTIESFLDIYKKNWNDDYADMSRYTSSYWQSLYNQHFKNAQNKDQPYTDRKTFTGLFNALLGNKYPKGDIQWVKGELANPTLQKFMQYINKIYEQTLGLDYFYDNYSKISTKVNTTNLTVKFKKYLDGIFDAVADADKGQDYQRWQTLDNYVNVYADSGIEGVSFQSFTEYIITDYTEECMDNTTWYQSFDWTVCGYSTSIDATEKDTIVSWENPIYFLAQNLDKSEITVRFDKAGTYFISCEQHCDLVISSKVNYVYQRYVYLKDNGLCVFVGNSFSDGNAAKDSWTNESVVYNTIESENKTTYPIAHFALHITEDDVGKDISFSKDGAKDVNYTTQRVS